MVFFLNNYLQNNCLNLSVFTTWTRPRFGKNTALHLPCVCARVFARACVFVCVCVFRPIIWWYLQALPVQQCEEHYSSFCSIASFFFTLKQKSAPPHTHTPTPHTQLLTPCSIISYGFSRSCCCFHRHCCSGCCSFSSGCT